MARLDGKIIIVTGGTQGVGEAVARHAAECGAGGVVICGRNQEKGKAVAASIEERDCPAVYVAADLEQEQDCRNVVRSCNERFGRVDGLVNAAADTNRGTLEETTVEFWDKLFAINVRAPFILTQEVVRIMKRQQISGSIVNVLSVAAHCGMDFICAYSSTKGALSTFTKNVAEALRFDRIRVNGVNLGWTDTPNEQVVQLKMGRPADWLQRAEKESPFGRLIKPLDVARLCVYLLSEESGVMTGSLIDYSQRVIGAFPKPSFD